MRKHVPIREMRALGWVEVLEWIEALATRGVRGRRAETLRVSLAVLSAASGIGLVCAPRAFGMLFGLPVRPGLCRALGTRDLALGVLMLSPRARLGLAGRAASDVADALIIAREARRRPRDGTAGRLAVAALSAASAGALAARRRN
jgi:hypothetical protein